MRVTRSLSTSESLGGASSTSSRSNRRERLLVVVEEEAGSLVHRLHVPPQSALKSPRHPISGLALSEPRAQRLLALHVEEPQLPTSPGLQVHGICVRGKKRRVSQQVCDYFEAARRTCGVKWLRPGAIPTNHAASTGGLADSRVQDVVDSAPLPNVAESRSLARSQILLRRGFEIEEIYTRSNQRRASQENRIPDRAGRALELESGSDRNCGGFIRVHGQLEKGSTIRSAMRWR